MAEQLIFTDHQSGPVFAVSSTGDSFPTHYQEMASSYMSKGIDLFAQWRQATAQQL